MQKILDYFFDVPSFVGDIVTTLLYALFALLIRTVYKEYILSRDKKNIYTFLYNNRNVENTIYSKLVDIAFELKLPEDRIRHICIKYDDLFESADDYLLWKLKRTVHKTALPLYQQQSGKFWSLAIISLFLFTAACIMVYNDYIKDDTIKPVPQVNSREEAKEQFIDTQRQQPKTVKVIDKKTTPIVKHKKVLGKPLRCKISGVIFNRGGFDLAENEFIQFHKMTNTTFSFAGSTGIHDISGTARSYGNYLKIISGNVSGNITLSADCSSVSCNITIKETGQFENLNYRK